MLELKYKIRTYISTTWGYYVLTGTLFGVLIWFLFYLKEDISLQTVTLSFSIGITFCIITMIINGLAHRGSYISVKDNSLNYHFVKYNYKILFGKKTAKNKIVKKVYHYRVDKVNKITITGNGYFVYGNIILEIDKSKRNKTEHKELHVKKVRMPYYYGDIEKLALCF